MGNTALASSSDAMALADIENVHFDLREPVDERFRKFQSIIGDPRHYRVGIYTIHANYSSRIALGDYMKNKLL